MNFKKNIFFYISGVWICLLFLLGSWWLILIKKLGKEISPLNSNLPNLSKLTLWEGGTFFIILILLSLLLIALYNKDVKKQKSLQTFFATMTHELKTPLASIHLQSEVINEEAINSKNERIETLSNRLIEETWHLENHIDKILQLARVERSAPLHLESISINQLLEKIKDSAPQSIEFSYENNFETKIMIDQFALNIIFRNLFENTLKHSGQKQCSVTTALNQENIIITYTDHNHFDGDLVKIDQLFYKHKSPKGSGIGLYLCQSLMKSMNGYIDIKQSEHVKQKNCPNIYFNLILPLRQS